MQKKKKCFYVKRLVGYDQFTYWSLYSSFETIYFIAYDVYMLATLKINTRQRDQFMELKVSLVRVTRFTLLLHYFYFCV